MCKAIIYYTTTAKTGEVGYGYGATKLCSTESQSSAAVFIVVIKVADAGIGYHSETAVSDNTNAFGASYEQQAAYSTPITPSPLVLTSAGMREENYPIKLGYTENDRYLIGKYTCGAYLYIAPKSYEDIGATSFSPTAAKRLIEFGTTSAIQIPLIFQYRCSDYLKYVGGYRGNATSGLVNVKYAKKIGLDISLKEETFSFDVLVSAEYDKETTKTVPTSFTTITNTTAGAPTTNTI